MAPARSVRGSLPPCGAWIGTGAVTFVDIGGAEGACPVDRRAALERLHAREGATGPVLSGAAAFAAMWRAIPVLRPFGLLARNGLVLRGLEWAYLRFLRLRPPSRALTAARGAIGTVDCTGGSIGGTAGDPRRNERVSAPNQMRGC